MILAGLLIMVAGVFAPFLTGERARLVATLSTVALGVVLIACGAEAAS